MDHGVYGQDQSRRRSNACAPCRHQRRRCPSDCLLAPYFPANQEQDFINAYKLFGLGNMAKTIRTCQNPEEKRVAAQTMKWEANLRANIDPVYGSAGIIWDLYQKIQSCQLELNALHHLLEHHRPQYQHQHQLQYQHQNVDYPFSGLFKLDLECSPFQDENHQKIQGS